VTETLERRPASLVVVRTGKPKFVAKDRAAQRRDASVAGAGAGVADRSCNRGPWIAR
jgi:hypothetical protein